MNRSSRRRFGRAFGRQRYVIQHRHLSKWETPWSVALDHQIGKIVNELRDQYPRDEIRVIDTRSGRILERIDGFSSNEEGSW